MEEARCGADFPGIEASIPVIQIKFPPFSVKSVHPSVNLPGIWSYKQCLSETWVSERQVSLQV